MIFVYFGFGFLIGLSIGITLIIILNKSRSKLEDTMQHQFERLSQQSMQQTQKQFFQIANETFKSQQKQHETGLENKKNLIDQTIQTVQKEIENVKKGLHTIELNHHKRFGEMSGFLQQHHQTTQQLMQTTSDLKEALANSKIRGQWGERMAEDVLRFSGFIEGINYVKQTATEQGIPDFTFFLPKNKTVNMDVKFPLNNYLSFLNEPNETNKESKKKQFIKDVRHHIKTITDRQYTGPDTLDYVMIFIPNEQIYQFMHDHDPELIDFSLKQKVVLCSPITLYAMLAIIRQTVDHFSIETKAREMMDILSQFQDQWEKYKGSLNKLGKKIDDMQKEYTLLVTTRTNQLDRPLKKIDQLKQAKALENTP